MEADMKPSIVLLLSLALLSCNQVEAPLADLAKVEKNLAFTCKHEIIPAPPAETELLFNYARWLQKNNQLGRDGSVDVLVERLYRIASENGHFKASINLQNGAMRGVFNLRGNEHLPMSQQLIEAGVASGYYFVGMFLNQGSAGLQQDLAVALRYFRKAADEGSAVAQYSIGEKLEPRRASPEIALKMYRCAAEQGHGKAAIALGVYLKNNGKYQQALEVFQLGIAAGNSSASSRLSRGFKGVSDVEDLYFLDQEMDIGRAERYEKIWDVLASYSYAAPSVPEINDIVPLPPAKLPKWDGKLQWLEAYLANVAPDKPGEALITKLAEAKGLDPLTGKPLPGSPAFSQADLYPSRSYTGELCSTSGYWTKIELCRECAVDGPIARYIDKGEVMPPLLMRHYKRRHWPWSDKTTEYVEPVEWKLI